MCAQCETTGRNFKALELTLTVEFENGAKEIPFRAWSDKDNNGLHIVTDAGNGAFVMGLLSEALPMIIAHLEGETTKQIIN